jgi:hypothetical protein
MKSIVYRGPDRAYIVEGKKLVKGEAQEVSEKLADELLDGEKHPGHEFVEKKTDDKDAAAEPERKGSGIAQTQPDATTRADQ